MILQEALSDRRLILRILDALDLPTPNRLEVSRDSGPILSGEDVKSHIKFSTGLQLDLHHNSDPPATIELLDDGDTLCVDGVLREKPFVEKPVSSSDHDI